jgi:hypothetical protein
LGDSNAEYCDPHRCLATICPLGRRQELEACCEWLNYEDRGFWGCKLRTARRPKPPSLKEQALGALYAIVPLVLMTPESFNTLKQSKQRS